MSARNKYIQWNQLHLIKSAKKTHLVNVVNINVKIAMCVNICHHMTKKDLE